MYHSFFLYVTLWWHSKHQKLVVMMKSTASKFKQHLHLLKKSIKQFIIDTTQQFATSTLADIHQHAAKKKRSSVEYAFFDFFEKVWCSRGRSRAIKQLMAILGQSSSGGRQQVGPPTAALGLTQLHFARTMLLSIFGEAEKRPKGGLIKEREFKDAHYDAVDAFLTTSEQWAELWHLDGTFFLYSFITTVVYTQLIVTYTLQECQDM